MKSHYAYPYRSGDEDDNMLERELAQSPARSETQERYYTLQEAAHLLHLPICTLTAAMERGELPFTHQYARHLIAASDLDAYRKRYADWLGPLSSG